MSKIKILWFSNRYLDEDNSSTGTWLYALSKKLSDLQNFELYNVTEGNVDKINYSGDKKIKQYIIPHHFRNNHGVIKNKNINKIIKIIDNIKPNLIHVWGVENYWGLVTLKVNKIYPVLLEIQGIKSAIALDYFGRLNYVELLKTINIKELVQFDNIFLQKRKYSNWRKYENIIIENHDFISVHSHWANSVVKEINPKAVIFQNERLLRSEFYSANLWKPSNNKIIFTSIGYPAPFKGLHLLIKALVIIKQRIPDIKLVIAGNIKTKGIKADGYIKYLLREIKKNNLENHIEWLGGLKSEQLITTMHKSTVAVYPSFVESYGLALAESMSIGVPTVASYNGGYGYLGRNEVSVLFFPPGDHRLCAYQILRVIENTDLQKSLSSNAFKFIESNNNPVNIIGKQLETYRYLINKEK